jgi:hypothetical protein
MPHSSVLPQDPSITSISDIPLRRMLAKQSSDMYYVYDIILMKVPSNCNSIESAEPHFPRDLLVCHRACKGI